MQSRTLLFVALCTLAIASGSRLADHKASAQDAAAVSSSEEEALLAAELNEALSEQVVSAASRTAETVEQAPVAASIVRADDLQRYGMRTLDEALRFIAMGTFTLGGQASSVSVGARGLGIDGDSSNHILVLVDGHPVNQPFGTGGLVGYGLGLPLTMIDSIEVILGPGSVVYGGNAMLGVLSVHTKPARQMGGLRVFGQYAISPAQTADGEIKNFHGVGLGQSHRVEATYGKSFRFEGREGEVTIGLLSARTELPSLPIAAQSPFPGAPPIFAAFGGAQLRGLTLDSGSGGYSRLRIGRFSADASYVAGSFPSLIPAPQLMDAQGTNFDFQMMRANLVQNFEHGAHFTGFAALRALHFEPTIHRHSQVCLPGGTPGSFCTEISPNRAISEQLELQGTWDFLADGRYQLLAGLDGRMRQAASRPTQYDDATGLTFGSGGSFQSTGQALGAYAQFRGSFTHWLAVNLGIRADRVRDAGKIAEFPAVNPVTYGPSRDVVNHAISPRVAAMFFPTEHTTLYGGYSRAFRAPSPVENFLVAPGVEPSVSLKAETVDSGEIGIKHRFGVHRLTASTFVSKWHRLIGFQPGDSPGNVRFDSTGQLNNYGVNLGVEGALAMDRVHYGMTFTYGYSRRALEHDPASAYPAAVQQALAEAKEKPELIGAPAVYGSGRISYDFRGLWPEIGLAAVVYGPRLTSFAYSNRLLLASGDGAMAMNTPIKGYVWRTNLDPKFVDPMVELRLNLVGSLPRLPALRYHLLINYLASPGFQPTSYGPTPGGTVPAVGLANGTVAAPKASGQLFPAIKLTMGLALEVVFGP